MSDNLFGPFRLLAARRLLFEGDKPVRLGSRALDILIVLTEQPGELVGKGELMARVWPGITVEETNLAVNVAALRRALGDGQAGARYIVNIPGRGYRFVAPVAITDEPPPPARLMALARPHNLPARLTRLIGRADFVADLIRLLPQHRIVTIVGAAAVGKTSVALEAAEQVIPAYQLGVWLIDLASIADPRLVPTALASALRKTNRWPQCGSRFSVSWTISASPSKPLRMSVWPVASHTRTPAGIGIIAVTHRPPARAPQRRRPRRR